MNRTVQAAAACQREAGIALGRGKGFLELTVDSRTSLGIERITEQVEDACPFVVEEL